MADDSPLDPGQPGPAAADAPEPAEDTATALADLKRDRDDLYDRLLRKTAAAAKSKQRGKTQQLLRAGRRASCRNLGH